MTPDEIHRSDQARAGLTEALAHPCSCGDCATDDELRALLALPDDQLLEHLGDVTP